MNDSAPTLVACDIDGTLLVTGQRPSDAVVASLRAARDAGHVIVLATGRSLYGALVAAYELGILDGWIVASNGAVVVELVSGSPRIQDLHQVDAEAVVRVVTAARPNLKIAAEIVGVGYHVSARFPANRLPGEQVVASKFAELWAEPTPRLAVYGENASLMVRTLRTGGMTAIAAQHDWVDVTAGDVSKATALEGLRKEFGIPEQNTMAIGDSENDIPMLTWAERGVAMGNADSLIKFSANYATKSVEDDGAALILQALARLGSPARAEYTRPHA